MYMDAGGEKCGNAAADGGGDLYAVLGLKKECSDADLKVAYRKLAKTDLSLLRRPNGRAVAVGITGAVVPLAVTLRGSSLITELAVRLSLSSFPVIADALSDLDLLNTDLGRIALTASLITDVTLWILRACSAAVFLVSEAMSPAFTAKILASFVAFVLIVGFVARPAGFRVLTCLYSEDHAAPLIDLLEASGSSHDSPMSLIVLHLMELVGRAASVLKPHRKSTSSSNPTPSDRIVNAFRYFEQQAAPGAVMVSPYVAQVPYSSMHHDVCSLAHSSSSSSKPTCRSCCCRCASSSAAAAPGARHHHSALYRPTF